MKLQATVTFEYEVGETAYPGGMTEADIAAEEDIVLEMLKADFRRERVEGKVLDIQVANITN